MTLKIGDKIRSNIVVGNSINDNPILRVVGVTQSSYRVVNTRDLITSSIDRSDLIFYSQVETFEDSITELWKREYSIECDHEWVKYTGFRETYKFCKKCDKKS